MTSQTTFSEHLETRKGEWVYMKKVVLVQPEIDKLNIRIDADGWGQRGGSAWFDDLKIEQLDMSQNEIVSETNYYPFGLAHKGYNEQVSSSNLGEKYKFNGKELNDAFGLNFTDFGWRNYMSDIGRWISPRWREAVSRASGLPNLTLCFKRVGSLCCQAPNIKYGKSPQGKQRYPIPFPIFAKTFA